MSGDRLREAAQALLDAMSREAMTLPHPWTVDTADAIVVLGAALAADERGGGEVMDVTVDCPRCDGKGAYMAGYYEPEEVECEDCHGKRTIVARLAAAQPASHAAEGERRELPTAEWARLRAIDDIVRELVDGWDNGFPMEDDHSATDVIERLRPYLTEPQEPHVAESGEPRP